MPGGTVDPGETAAESIIRESYEETGLRVKPVRCIGLIKHRNTYPNGDEIEVHIMAFRCKVIGGELESLDGESLELRYFYTSDLPESVVLEPYPRVLFDPEYQGCYFEGQENSFI
jgi:8-oxo-dGTP pyrophosphatase MutT (NUDIX family)